MLLAERGLGAIERANGLPDGRAARLDQPMLVPQLLDGLAPLVEIRGVAMRTGAHQGLASTAVRDLETRRQRSEVTMRRTPCPGTVANLVERGGGLSQGPVALRRALHGLLP